MCFNIKKINQICYKPIKIQNKCKYFLVRNFITGKYLDIESDDYYTTFGELTGATVFDEELYSYLSEEHKKDTHKVYIHILK